MRPQPVLEQGEDADSGDRRLDREVGGAADAYGQRPARIDAQDLSVPLELPFRRPAAREAAADAGMVQKVARVLRTAAPVEIGRRRDRGEALLARADRHGDHVLFEPLVVADAGIAARGQHIDEAVLGDHVEADVRIGGQERRHDPGQDQPGRADRHIEPERAGRPVAKTVDDVERRLDLAQGRRQALQETRSRLRRGDAARRAVEQAHAEPPLQAADGLAQPGRAHAGRPRAVAKAAGLRHRDEGGEVAEIRRHCSFLRTARADTAVLSRGPAGSRAAGVTQERPR